MAKQRKISIADGAYTNAVSKLNTQGDKASYGTFNRTILHDYELENVYQDWLAKKIVNRPVMDMLRQGWFYQGLNETQIQQFDDELLRLNLVQKIGQAMIYSRLYGKGYLVFGFNDGLDLTQPLSMVKRGQFSFLMALKPSVVNAETQYLTLEDSQGELNKPRFYQITYDNQSKRIHHSRVIEIRHNDDGESLLLSMYQTLLNYASVNASSASLVHESKIDVIRVPDLMQALIEKGEQVIQRFASARLLKSINGMLVLDKEEEYDSKSYNFSGLPELMRAFSQQTAGASDIPYTILFGETTSGLNNSGEFDLRNYYDVLATEQQWRLRPILQRIFLVVLQSLFGQVPTGFYFEFNPLWQMDVKTRSEVEKHNAERDKIYLELGIINEHHIAQQLVQDGTYDFIDDDYLNLLEGLGNAPELETNSTAGEKT